jgi:hypothetical protein
MAKPFRMLCGLAKMLLIHKSFGDLTDGDISNRL